MAIRQLIEVRLKEIHTCDFRKSEWTNYYELAKKHKFNLRQGESVCLLSSNQRVLYFIFAPLAEGKEIALFSVKGRIDGGSWNPYRLANYAADVGLKLVGIKLFEKYYQELWEHKHHHTYHTKKR